MTADEASEAKVMPAEAAKLLDLSRSSLLRIPRDQLDYWETPGGEKGRRHRRYRRADLVRYARNHLGRDVR